MGIRVSALAVYGFRVDDELEAQLSQLVYDIGCHNPEWTTYIVRASDEFLRTYQKLAEPLRTEYNVMHRDCFFWTGDEDQHLGECETESEHWLFGYGLQDFPVAGRYISDKMLSRGEWHTWVEAG